MVRGSLMVLGVIWWLIACGCESIENIDRRTGAASTPPPSRRVSDDPQLYRQIIERYNQNLKHLDRIWARVVIELTWTDERGGHFEQGDGNLIMVLPDRVAVSIGKLGHTLMWAGGDPERYWLFDLRERKTVYVGRHDEVQSLDADRWPIPFYPLDLMPLLGLLPIDPSPLPPSPMVEWHEGGYLIEPPGSRCRLLINPKTGRAQRIDLMDDTGHSRAIGRLSRHRPMSIHGTHSGAFPWIATRLELSLVHHQGTMTLFLSDVSDGREYNRIKDKAFDLDHLTKAFKPDQQVDLRPPSSSAD